MNVKNPSQFAVQVALMCEKAHRMSKEKGWYENPRSALEIHALVHSEISEATEEERKGTPAVYQEQLRFDLVDLKPKLITPDMSEWVEHKKPEGAAVELADAVIRIMDHFAARGWDLGSIIELKMAFNQNRSHRHGGKLF